MNPYNVRQLELFEHIDQTIKKLQDEQKSKFNPNDNGRTELLAVHQHPMEQTAKGAKKGTRKKSNRTRSISKIKVYNGQI